MNLSFYNMLEPLSTDHATETGTEHSGWGVSFRTTAAPPLMTSALIAALALPGLTAAALAHRFQSPDAASQETLPGEGMYAARSKDAWQHVTKMAARFGFRARKNDGKHQVLVTEWRNYDEALFPRLEALDLPATDKPVKIQLHIAVAPEREPARVAVGSILQLERLSSGRRMAVFSYRHSALDAWIFEALDAEMNLEHHRMPAAWEGRTALAAKLRPADVTDRCFEAGKLNFAGDRKPPVITSEVQPVFPSDGYTSGPGKVAVRAVLTEHGTVTNPQIVSPSPDLAHYEASARAAFGLWRYRPAVIGTCPSIAVLTVNVNYALR